MLNSILNSQPLSSNLSNFIYVGMRFLSGISMAFSHGIGKIPPSDAFINAVSEDGLPMAAFFAWSAALSESLGGVLLALGLFTRPASFFLLCTMLFAGLVHHAADPFGSKEKAILYALIAAFYLINGGGKYSGDSMLLKK